MSKTQPDALDLNLAVAGDFDLNQRAMQVADRMARRARELAVAVSYVGGARLIDAGVNQTGGIEAGVMLVRACMADLGQVSVVPGRVGDCTVPAVAVYATHPVAACMASQYAGWQINVGRYLAMGSGPMRVAARTEPLFDQIGFAQSPNCVVGLLEASRLPDEQVVEAIVAACGVEAGRTTLLVAPTASVAGSIQVVGRSLETALHKLHEIGFDLDRVTGGFGVAPVPPVAENDLAAIGRTNDAVLYGGQVTLYVRGDDDSMLEAGRRLPSSASPDYGEPFAEIFKRCGHDFYKIDPMLFSPAAVCMQNVQTGRACYFGRTNDRILRCSFFAEAPADP